MHVLVGELLWYWVEEQCVNLAQNLQQGLSLIFSPTFLISGRNEEDYYYGGRHPAGTMFCESTAEESCVANGCNLSLHLSGPVFWGPAAYEFLLGYIFFT